MRNNIIHFILVLFASCYYAQSFTYHPPSRASFFDILNFELNFIENYERQGLGDFQNWKQIQKSKDDDDDVNDDGDLAEKIYNELQTIIQEKIHDLPKDMNRYDKDAEKIYNGLQTLIQEKIHDLPEELNRYEPEEDYEIAEKDTRLERRGVADFPKWKDIQIMPKYQQKKEFGQSNHDDLAEKMYNGLETLIQEKISGFSEEAKRFDPEDYELPEDLISQTVSEKDHHLRLI